MADHSHDLNCVCDVCTCGRHRCPPPQHKDKHYDPNLLQTTNQRDLKEWPLSPSQGYKPPPHMSTGGAFTGTTTNQRDFQAPPADGYARSPNVHGPGATPNRPFVGKSTYDRDFIEHDGDGRMPIQGSAVHLQRHAGEGAPSAPFQGETTYNHEFVPQATIRSDPLMIAAEASPSLPFTGKSTYDRDFPGHEGAPRQPIRIGNQYTPNPAPFNGHTTHRDAFTGIQPDPCPAGVLSARPPSPDGHMYYRKSSIDQQIKEARTGQTPEARKLAF